VEVTGSLQDPLLESLLAPKGPSFETLRVLRTKVKSLGAERPFRAFGVVAATRGEGASSVALGLAIALAQEPGRRVLLVEADLDAPKLEASLGLEGGPGLAERLEGRADGDSEALRRVLPFGLFVLPAGQRSGGVSDVLASPAMARVTAELRAGFDFVVFDCPPLDHSADAVVIQGLVDGFLLVVRARHAAKEVIRRALTQLRPEAIRGVVFNDRTEILGPWLDRRRGDR
jgi:succinoglycan biosynthesis transport protein ExoP